MMIALMLSYKTIEIEEILYLESIYFINNSWVQLLSVAIYSAFAIERDTQFCFLLNHTIKLFDWKKHPLEALLRSSEHPA